MKRAVTGLWRWRASPLYRGTDRREAWLTMCAAVLVVVVVPLVGWLTDVQAHRVLLDTVRHQHAVRHQVRATVEVFVHGRAEDDEDDSGLDEGRRARVSWTDPDGVTQSGVTTVGRRVLPGQSVQLWIGARGGITIAPMSPAAASFHSLLAGIVGGAAAGGAVEGGRRLALGRMRRARYTRWDEEWARSGPGWGRTGTGN